MVILDTSIIIDHLRQTGKKSFLQALIEKLPGETFALSVITIQELYEGQSTRDKDRENHLLILLSQFKIVPYDYNVAELAGKITRDTKPLVSFADAAIAATTIINGCQLYTLDKKDFSSINNLELI